MRKTLFTSVAVAALSLGTVLAVAQGQGPGAGAGGGNPGMGGTGGAMSPGGTGSGSVERRQSPGGESGQPSGRAQQGQGEERLPAGRAEGQQPSGGAEGRQPGRAEGQPPAGQKQTTGQSKEGASSHTTGAIGGAAVSTEQRTQVRQTFSNVNVHRVQNVNFSISVGAIVPRTVTFYDLPPDIVRIVPAYRRFKYVAVGDEIVIIDPERFVIVEVIRL